jgi:membrane-associated phospholipid phosphatase
LTDEDETGRAAARAFRAGGVSGAPAVALSPGHAIHQMPTVNDMSFSVVARDVARHGRRAAGYALVSAALLGPGTPRLAAQAADSASRATSATSDTSRPFPLGAISRLDAGIATQARSPGLQSSAALRATSDGFSFVGFPGTALVAGSLFVVGEAARDAQTSELGVRAAEALVVGGATALLLKGLVGRARPDNPAGNVLDIRPARGFRNDAYGSFPSGHTAVAFAVATVVSGELSRRDAGSRAVIVTTLYTGATLVGVSRIFNDRHWTSDVIAGAALGIVAGHVTLSFHH